MVSFVDWQTASNVHEPDGTTAITYVELVDGERGFGEYEEGVLADFHLTEEDIEYIGKHDMMVTGLWGNLHRMGRSGIAEKKKELHAKGPKLVIRTLGCRRQLYYRIFKGNSGR